MTRKIVRGVNLGGWLVLEKWMTPSLFAGTDAVDEYTFMQAPDAAKKLERHRKTFITEKDFKWLSEHGLNAIRLPVGYWIIEPDALYVAGLEYVDWAFQMGGKYNLNILLDLHAAPDSQNGHDHSGRIGRAGWFDNETARRRSGAILQKLHERYKNSPSYWGIELLNEPKTGLFNRTLRHFYTSVAARLGGVQRIVFSDGYRPRRFSGALGKDKRAVMDLHLYHMASYTGRFISARQFVRIAGWKYARLLRHTAHRQPVIVGEWSVVMRNEKTTHLSECETRAIMRDFADVQLSTYERFSAGWFYWNYKTENGDPWNFRWCVENDIIEL